MTKKVSFRSGKGCWVEWHLSRYLNAVRDLSRSCSIRGNNTPREKTVKTKGPGISQASRKDLWEYQTCSVIANLSISLGLIPGMVSLSLDLLRRGIKIWQKLLFGYLQEILGLITPVGYVSTSRWLGQKFKNFCWNTKVTRTDDLNEVLNCKETYTLAL